MKKDPPLYTITVSERNAAGFTPGVYVRLSDLQKWLNNRKLKKTSKALRYQVIDGVSSEVKTAGISTNSKRKVVKKSVA